MLQPNAEHRNLGGLTACSGTAKGDYGLGGYSERRRREFVRGSWGMLPREILKSETSQSPRNAIKFTS